MTWNHKIIESGCETWTLSVDHPLGLSVYIVWDIEKPPAGTNGRFKARLEIEEERLE